MKLSMIGYKIAYSEAREKNPKKSKKISTKKKKGIALFSSSRQQKREVFRICEGSRLAFNLLGGGSICRCYGGLSSL